jgi:sugar lactone lactonase YvrE
MTSPSRLLCLGSVSIGLLAAPFLAGCGRSSEEPSHVATAPKDGGEKAVSIKPASQALPQPAPELIRVVTTIAGLQSWPGPNGENDEISSGIAVDEAKNIYACTFRSGNSIIWVISSSGAAKALAVVDESGNLETDPTTKVSIKLIADDITIKTAGAITSVENKGIGFVSRLTAKPMAVEKLRPLGMAVDKSGHLYLSTKAIAVDSSSNIYVADTVIQKISPSGVVTKIAGYAEGSNDGTGPEAQFKRPHGIAVDKSGTLFVADTGNGTIRRITPEGVVTTFAGTANFLGWSDSATNRKAIGRDSDATFFSPEGIAVDESGNVYVADSGGRAIRKITPTGTVSTLAGQRPPKGESLPTGWADGPSEKARFDSPTGITLDAAGEIYVTDKGTSTGRSTIRKIALTSTATPSFSQAANHAKPLAVSPVTGEVSTFAFGLPSLSAVAADDSGNVYVAASKNGQRWCGQIQKITPKGEVTILAGIAPDEPARNESLSLRFNRPQGIAVDKLGNVYVTDQEKQVVQKITPDGVMATLAGHEFEAGYLDGKGGSARFSSPSGIAVDDSGNLYVADSFNQTIRKLTPDGVVSTLAGTRGAIGSADGKGSSARFNNPSRVAVDNEGNVYVLEYAHAIRKITADGTVTTLAGEPGAPGAVDAQGSEARFDTLQGVAVDKAGNVYAVDSDVIRAITPDGVVTTLAGKRQNGGTHVPDSYNHAAVPLEKVKFAGPSGIAVNSTGSIYVADDGEIRAIKLSRSAER